MAETPGARHAGRAAPGRAPPKVARNSPPHPAVHGISDDWMADFAQVDANLMRPPGRDRHVDQRHARQFATRRSRASPPTAPGARAPTFSCDRTDLGRSEDRCVSRRERRPRRARRIPFRSPCRGIAVRAPRARDRFWRPPSVRTSRDRGDERFPASTRRRFRSDRSPRGAAR